MQPMAANERRKGFIDNSLGTKLLEKPVLNYYDNDSIEKGPYKMLVNCYENCFFTYNIINTTLKNLKTLWHTATYVYNSPLRGTLQHLADDIENS